MIGYLAGLGQVGRQGQGWSGGGPTSIMVFYRLKHLPQSFVSPAYNTTKIPPFHAWDMNLSDRALATLLYILWIYIAGE